MKIKYLLLALLVVSTNVLVYSQTLRYTRELIIFVKNGNPNDSITFSTESNGPITWDQSGFITRNPIYVHPCDLIINLDSSGGSSNPNYGWDTNDPGQDEPHLGRGYYTISVDVGNATLSVDCYGINWIGHDIVVVYDYKNDKFSPDSVDLYNNPSGLQPTPPQNFICTNKNNQGENPHFEWWWPDKPRPASWPFNFKYKIYRSENYGPFLCVESALSFYKPPLEWTDFGVSISSSGSRYGYYVTAYTDDSPESGASNKEFIRGNPYKLLPDTLRKEQNNNPNNFHVISKIYIYPNPFNPETQITYSLHREAFINLSVYNIAGQKVTTLIEKHQCAGEHSVVFNGKNLPAGIYLVHLRDGRENYLQKVLLVK